MLPWAHPSPQPKRYLDWFSHFCTAHGSVVGHDLSPKLPLCMGNHAFLGPPESIHSHSSSAVCAQLTSECRRACRCPPPSILPVPVPGPTPSKTWSLRSTRLSIPNSISVQPAQLTRTVPILYFTMGAPFPPKLPFLMGSSGPSKPTTRTASPSVQPFLHSSPQTVPIIYNGRYPVFHH